MMLRFGVLLIASMLVAGPAHAARCEAPPGTAAVEQYCEAIPDEGGNTPSARFQEARPRERDPAAAPGQRAVTEGVTEAGLAAVVAGTGPSGAVGTRPRDEEDGPSLPAAPGGLIAAVRSSVGAGPTTGTFFVAGLVAIALVVGVLAAVDHRRRREQG